MDGGGGGTTHTVTNIQPIEGMKEIPKYVGNWLYNKDDAGNVSGQIPTMFNDYIPYLKKQVWDRTPEERVADFAPEEKSAQGYVTGSFGNMADSLWNVNNAVTGWGLGQVPRANEAFTDAYSQFNDWSNNLRNRSENPNQMGMGNLENTIRGDYVRADSNPYLGDYMKLASQPTIDALEMNMAQNAGSSGMAGRDTTGSITSTGTSSPTATSTKTSTGTSTSA